MAKEKKNPPRRLKALSRAVRVLREAAQLSQEELADRAEIDRTYISGIERSVRNPSFLVLWKIADALGVSFSKLAETAEQPPR